MRGEMRADMRKGEEKSREVKRRIVLSKPQYRVNESAIGRALL